MFLVAILNDRFELTIERERNLKSVTFDSTFSSQIKQRKEDIELLFYRLLQQVVLHERERSFNNGIEITTDLSVILLLFNCFFIYYFLDNFT